jgi:hypothetical protein
MIGWAKEVCTILTELRITECQEFVMAISNLDTIEEGTVNTSEQFIVSLFLGTSVDTTLRPLALTEILHGAD